jgi:tetratricopeptide (TPR) repeat protein
VSPRPIAGGALVVAWAFAAPSLFAHSASRLGEAGPDAVAGRSRRAAQADPAVAVGLVRRPARGEAEQAAPGGPRASSSRQGGGGVLARDPSTLPVAPAGRWAGWTPASPAPEELQADLARAAVAWSRRDAPASLAALFAVLETRPDYPPAWHQCGVIYFRLQRYGDAIRAFERYLGAAPGRVGDTRALGHGLYSLGRYAEARAHYERVLEVQPDSVEALRGLALARLRTGAPKRALELLERVVSLAPDHASAHAWIAQVHFDAGRLDEALAAADRARALAPFSARAWFLASRVLFESGRDEEGEAARARFELLARAEAERRTLEARLLLDPARPALLAKLVDWCRRIGDGDGARSALGRWLALEPTDVPLRILVLDVEAALGEAASASRAAADLARVGAEDPRARRRLVRYYTRTGEYDR